MIHPEFFMNHIFVKQRSMKQEFLKNCLKLYSNPETEKASLICLNSFLNGKTVTFIKKKCPYVFFINIKSQFISFELLAKLYHIK